MIKLITVPLFFVIIIGGLFNPMLGFLFNRRAWCSFCPMGLLQETVGSYYIKKKINNR